MAATGESPESASADRSRSGYGTSGASGASESPPKVARGVEADRSGSIEYRRRATAAPARTLARSRGSASHPRPNERSVSLEPGHLPSFTGVHEVVLSDPSQGEGISSEEVVERPLGRRQSTQYNLTGVPGYNREHVDRSVLEPPSQPSQASIPDGMIVDIPEQGALTSSWQEALTSLSASAGALQGVPGGEGGIQYNIFL